MERYLSIEKNYLKYHYLFHIGAALFLCILAPFIVGMEALNREQTGQVLDCYLSLSGIILIIPLFWPEQNRDIRELISSKEFPIAGIYVLRLIQAVFVLSVVNLAFLALLMAGGCSFPFVSFFFCSMASCVFMGSLGVFVYGMSGNLAVAYMTPFFYYICNYGAGAKYLRQFYLFSLMQGNQENKIWLGAAGVILLVLGIWLGSRKR